MIYERDCLNIKYFDKFKLTIKNIPNKFIQLYEYVF